MLSLPITLLILLVALGALVAASVPLVLALTSVMATMALVAIPSQVFPLERQRRRADPADRAGRRRRLLAVLHAPRARGAGQPAGARATRSRSAAATSGRAVMISGLTVIIAMAGMFITGDADVHLVRRRHRSAWSRRDVRRRWSSCRRCWPGSATASRRAGSRSPGAAQAPAGESRFWGAVVTRVMRRPVLSVVVAGGLLVALAIPALSMNVVQTGTDDLPQDLPVMQTYDRYTEAFPAEANAVEVVVEADDVRSGEVGRGDRRAGRRGRGLRRRCSTAAEVDVSDDGTVASVAIPSAGNGTDDESMAALDEVRDELVPATVGAVDGADGQRHRQRRSVRATSAICSPTRMPLVFAFVLGLAFLLMLVTFRSIVIPIKAIVLNLLSVGAAYGVLVLVFQNGWGESAARLRVQRRRHQLAAPVPVRDPVRALDGLPRVHPDPGPGALRPGHEHRGRGPQGHRRHAPAPSPPPRW